jgi:hypothetical protein
MDFTGLLNIPTLALSSSLTIYGSLTLISSSLMTISSTATLTFRGSGNYTWTFAGQAMTRDLTISPLGNPANYGTWTLSDNLIIPVTTGTFTLTSGTFNTNNKNLYIDSFNSSNSNTRTLTMGSSEWHLIGTGTVWTTGTATGLTFNPNTSTIILDDTTATVKTFAGGALTFNDLVITGGAVTWNNSTSFNNLTIYANSTTITVSAPTTKTILGNFNVLGSSASAIVTFVSTNPGTQYTFNKTSGTVNVDYVSLTDSIASGGATFYAGSHSSGSNTTGWLFSPSSLSPSSSVSGSASPSASNSPSASISPSSSISPSASASLSSSASLSPSGSLSPSASISISVSPSPSQEIYGIASNILVIKPAADDIIVKVGG